MRVRYGTGVFLNFVKRICNINIELAPDNEGLGNSRIDFHINDDDYVINASSAVSRQFFLFTHSLFCLYEEKFEDHHFLIDKEPELKYERDSSGDWKSISANFVILAEGPSTEITINRLLPEHSLYPSSPDPMLLTINSTRYGTGTYEIDGRDLCYAVAKACTDAMKKYGILGWGVTTSCLSSGDKDYFDIYELLFIKAYALNALEVRELKEEKTYYKSRQSNYYRTYKTSSFAKELELLLYDM